MASPSSFPSRNYKFNVFASFHGPDVRKTLLSHIREQFKRNGITMFNDQDIERSATIAPSLTKAIRESRISIVILSKKYASSSWCLDELVEILECKIAMGQIVMTIFYGVEPSDVRKQTGEFGITFNETCARKTEDEKQKWSKALNEVGNIAGEDFLRWDNEARMVQKIAKDVLLKLNVTPSRDFDGMVGLETHLWKLQSLLDFDYEGVMMVAISGPAGIGKTTIARALHSLLSNRFQLACFVDNLRESHHTGFDDYGLMLCLQEQFLSKVLNQNGMRIYHLGAIKENLCDQKVLIILDDVNNLKQLEALAGDISWFGPGSRIVVTTENQELLQQHGIDKTYHVEFPSHKEALKILCTYAFRQTSPRHGFKGLAESVTELCGNLPLGLRVVGSSLRGKNEKEWEKVIRRLDTILDHIDIEKVLRVGYESLHENEQSLFLHIAVFFNHKDSVIVEAMFADNNLDIEHGLKILANKSLIQKSTNGEIVMHKLLQQMATKAVRREEPWKHRILVDAQEICDVLERAKGSRAVSGILFDTSGIDELSINEGAFRRMHDVRFLKVYQSKEDGNNRVHIPETMEFPRRLRLLDWEAYPGKSLPLTLQPKYLVELSLRGFGLKKLWEGTQPLTNLKKMNLFGSSNLKELPDLSNATNLESLNLTGCLSLVEIPFSFENLHKLEKLEMNLCTNLQVVPTHFNLASLQSVRMVGCWNMRKIPDISRNITHLLISDTMLEELPESIRLWSHLKGLHIYGSVNTKNLVEIFQTRSAADIEILPDWMKDLHGLSTIRIVGCPKLASLPELPPSLKSLTVDTCESLETVSFPVDSHIDILYFPNCFKLGQEARRVIIQQSGYMTAYLPGRIMPAEFDHRATGSSVTILTKVYRFKICVVISPKQLNIGQVDLRCRLNINGFPFDTVIFRRLPKMLTEHLFISQSKLFDDDDIRFESDTEILFQFITSSQGINIIQCGVKILKEA
ncbi:Disease resistance protein RML1B [Cardamine amara subsp. amara]|uniref:ADP-ribosyl cyclase/cyclic ADP-ribose hydrolase n=1 Tax=Cardamine amara subsp. amara TaxID=228776 RepID=A0ABD1BG85_CARAN